MVGMLLVFAFPCYSSVICKVLYYEDVDVNLNENILGLDKAW